MSCKVHIRRCHLCGQVNEAEESLVKQCQHCGKTLTPFYYFNESQLMGLNHGPEKELSTSLPLKRYPPLWGLTAYWENSYESGNH